MHCIPQVHCGKNTTFPQVMIYVRAIYLSSVKVARQVAHVNVKRMLPSDMNHGLPGLGGLGVGGPQMERWKL